MLSYFLQFRTLYFTIDYALLLSIIHICLLMFPVHIYFICIYHHISVYHIIRFISFHDMYIYIYTSSIYYIYMYVFHPLHFPPVFRRALQAMEVPRIKRKKHQRSCKSKIVSEHDQKKVTARLHLQDLGITWPNFQRIHTRRMVSGFDIRFSHFFGCMASCFISFDVLGCFWAFSNLGTSRNSIYVF